MRALTRRTMSIVAVVVAGSISPATADAQPSLLPGASFDVAVGREGFRGDPFARAGMIGAELTIAGRFRRRPHGSLIAAAQGMQYYEGGNDLDCLIVGPDIGCKGRTFVSPHLGVLLGAELVADNTAFRITGGPLLYTVESSEPYEGPRSRSVTAMQLRGDVTFPATSSVAFTLSGSARDLGRIAGERITVISASVGVRLQPMSRR